jgi:hypothetical protein
MEDQNMNDQNADDQNPEDQNPDETLFTNRMNLELESISMNKLNDLGNNAIRLGLIAGHGHHGGQYELLHKGQVVTLSPSEAVTYLENLIQEVGS